MYGRLWEIKSRSVKDGPLVFIIVLHNDGVFAYHLAVGPLPSNFIFLSVLGSFFRADCDLGHPRAVVDIFLNRLWFLPVSYSRSTTMMPIPLVLVIPYIPLTSVLYLLSRVFYCV